MISAFHAFCDASVHGLTDTKFLMAESDRKFYHRHSFNLVQDKRQHYLSIRLLPVVSIFDITCAQKFYEADLEICPVSSTRCL